MNRCFVLNQQRNRVFKVLLVKRIFSACRENAVIVEIQLRSGVGAMRDTEPLGLDGGPQHVDDVVILVRLVQHIPVM
jgi:hypothetical protein